MPAIRRNLAAAGSMLASDGLELHDRSVGDMGAERVTGARSDGDGSRRKSIAGSLRVDHVMASSALPFIFPAIEVDGAWYGDGGIRLTAPLSPAIQLGARRIIAVSTRYARSRGRSRADAGQSATRRRAGRRRAAQRHLPRSARRGCRAARADQHDHRSPAARRTRRTAPHRDADTAAVRRSRPAGKRVRAAAPARLPVSGRAGSARARRVPTTCQPADVPADYIGRFMALGEADAHARARSRNSWECGISGRLMNHNLGTGRYISRRRFGALAGGAFASLALGSACHRGSEARPAAREGSRRGRSRQQRRPAPAGARSGWTARVTRSSSCPRTFPALPSALRPAARRRWKRRRRGSTPRPAADDAGVAVLAPDSRGSTWDAIRGSFGPDVTFLDRALERVFDTVAVDPRASRSADSPMAPPTRSRSD